MKFHTDDHFFIGEAHLGSGLPCQDYALSGVRGDMAFAIVSDGCSTGGRTDVGARIVAHTAETAIQDHWRRCADPTKNDAQKDIVVRQQVLLQQTQSNLGLVTHDLLATCAYAYVSPKGGYVEIRGDAVLAVVMRDGSITATKYSWAKNTPLYPAYFADDYTAFVRVHGGYETRSFEEETWRHIAGEWKSHGTAQFSVELGIRGRHALFSPGFAQEVAYIVLMSDGATQVEGKDWKDVVLELVSFKSVAGSFAKRRMISFVKNAHKSGKGPIDDIAYAVIRIDTEENSDGSR